MPVVPSAICNSEDLAPFVRKAFASRKPETLLHHLRAFSKSIESEIQEVCKAHYQDFILATQAVQRIGDSAGRIWDWLENGVCRMESSGSGSGVSIVERRESGEKWGYGSHEDWLKAGIMIAQKVLGKSFTLLNNRKHMVPSLTETAARYFVTRFFARYISTGSLTIMEEGGTIFTFKGKDNKFLPKVVLKVHKPQFYWKIMARADLGLADAYINEDFSVVDKDEGLQNLIMVLIANRDANYSTAKLKKKRGWWTPPLFTATIAYAKYFFQHVLRQNTLTQARRNISRHYDLSNELFSLFLDDTMAYSCAIFKREDEDLRIAQLRKISLLIEKARINKNHHVLEMGCGWGGLAIEVVKQTGCHYTGITLSEEQLKYAEKKVKDVGLQFISIPDERYDEHRLSSDFLREYIFPGGCLQSLSRLTAAMTTSSRFCVEHLENIGIHYYQTLRCWKKNFLKNKSQILELGFDESFIRTWEYYFDYCAAGFKSRTVGDYQIVFSRPGNVATFIDPYQRIPSASY